MTLQSDGQVGLEDGYNFTSHATSLVIPRLQSGGKLLFVLPSFYKRYDRVSIRHVMETGERGETLLRTMERALNDEVSMSKGSAFMELLSKDPIHATFGKDERNPGGIHVKGFYPVKVEGELRDYVKPDGAELLGPMVEMDAEELIISMEKQGTVLAHLDATKAMLMKYANESEAVYMRYSRVLARCRVPELTPEQKTAIRNYAKL